MKNYYSLLLFTFISQAAIGIVFAREAVILVGGVTRHSRPLVNSHHIFTLMLIVAMVSAFLHLGRPQNAIHAVRNITSSPLSMEIVSLSLLLGLAIVGSLSVFYKLPRLISSPLPVMIFIAALALLLTMTAVYLIPSVPAWNRPFTPLVFTLTALSAGPAILAIFLFPEEPGTAAKMTIVASIATVFLAVIYLLRLTRTGNSMTGLTLLLLAVTVVAIVAVILMLRSGEMNKTWRLTVISTTAIITSGLIGRLIFFLSYDNNIL
jgi:anaerobic dimethyl sulfoxide reductase subunit C